MISIAPLTGAESALVADLWNAKVLDGESCWFQTPPVDAAFVTTLVSSGFSIALARSGPTPVGFALWRYLPASFQLLAVAADTDEVYYRLLAEFCTRGLDEGASNGWAILGVANTREKQRMDALEVIQYAPHAYAPMTAEQTPDDRVVIQLRATCDLVVLQARLAQVLGDNP